MEGDFVYYLASYVSMDFLDELGVEMGLRRGFLMYQPKSEE
jgi:hypothetical protein